LVSGVSEVAHQGEASVCRKRWAIVKCGFSLKKISVLMFIECQLEVMMSKSFTCPRPVDLQNRSAFADQKPELTLEADLLL
ncbi:MAG: hypothetical protein ACKO85_16110, partial [Isosphaeraceae bacterium]